MNEEIKAENMQDSQHDGKPMLGACGYFHEAPQSDIDRLIAEHGTWGDIMHRYKQPDWCNYHNALEGQMGCWSLTDIQPNGLRNRISEDYCKSCPEFKKLGSHCT